MDSVVNQHKNARNPNAQWIAIVKLINIVNSAHVEIHVCKLERVELMLNVVWLIDRSNAHAHPATLEIQQSNALLN